MVSQLTCAISLLLNNRVIEAFVKHQMDCILDEDEDGNTPLHLASLNGYPKSVKILLNSHADFDARYVHSPHTQHSNISSFPQKCYLVDTAGLCCIQGSRQGR